MKFQVRLSDIIRGLHSLSDDVVVFYEKATGDLINISNDVLSHIEEGSINGNGHKFDKEIVEIASRILEKQDEYIEFPSNFDINDYEIMEDFCKTVESQEINKNLVAAMTSVGAIRKFNDVVQRFDLADEWNKFRDESYAKVAIEWCDSHDIDYTNDTEEKINN